MVSMSDIILKQFEEEIKRYPELSKTIEFKFLVILKRSFESGMLSISEYITLSGCVGITAVLVKRMLHW